MDTKSDELSSTDSSESMTKSLKKYTEILVSTKERYKNMYDNAPDLCRAVNTEGIVVDCNKSYAEHLGYSKEELIGRSIFETTAEESLDAIRDSFETWKQTGHVFNREIWLRRKDGTTFPTLLSATSLVDENGNVLSNSIIRDMSEVYTIRKEKDEHNRKQRDLTKQLKKANEELKTITKETANLAIELENANQELKRKDKLKDEFIGIASHELRSPIQPILGFATLAKSGKLDQQQAWEGVIKHAQRLQRIANDILDVSRIESDELTYTFEKVRINDVITDIVNSEKTNLINGVVIETILDKDIDIDADKYRIAQVLTNVIGNAVKFTKEGRINVESHIHEETSKLEIKVSDTAGGIPIDVLPHLFGKFVTRSIGSEVRHGTGLGLFISRAIVTAHKGRIQADNNNAGGATFTIVLPVKHTN
ncbi:MAG TPA: PAS domain-containing sensor histidine kinase [Nitrososphaerales archaeon]|nr:PAS domain-containing sensor histidine kinase [Nitrososphaerales archaeon]